MEVLIRGTGAAASCAAHLLTRSGLTPALETEGRAGVPAIMLSDAARNLIQDVFDNPALFRAAHQIRRRVVQWGPGAEPVYLDHSAVVVSERELLAELAPLDVPVSDPAQHADFTIFAARPLPPQSREHAFGSRMAAASRIHLKDPEDSATCWIESLAGGWLFLIPNAPGAGWLLSVGCPVSSALEQSRLIAKRVASVEPPAGQFPAGPRIAAPLCGPDWLACGSAALAFDPICGDGTAHAIREAILAQAVVRAIATGANAAEVLTHYEARLTAGLYRHLLACQEFYRNGDKGPWWDRELLALDRGLEWCAAKMRNFGKFRYALRGFDLEAVND